MEEDSDGDDCEGAVFEEEKDDEDEDTDIESEEDIVAIFELFWCARHHCKKKKTLQNSRTARSHSVNMTN